MTTIRRNDKMTAEVIRVVAAEPGICILNLFAKVACRCTPGLVIAHSTRQAVRRRVGHLHSTGKLSIVREPGQFGYVFLK